MLLGACFVTAVCVFSCSLSHSLLAISAASERSLVEPLLGVVLASQSPVPTQSWLCSGLPVLKRTIASVKDFVSVRVARLAPRAEL